MARIKAMLAACQIATGFTAGFALWAVSAPREAWDVNDLYSGCLALAGLVASLCRPRGFYWGIVGIYFGQVIAMHTLLPPGGIPIMPPFVGVLIFGTLPAAVGAALGAAIGYFAERALRKVRKPATQS